MIHLVRQLKSVNINVKTITKPMNIASNSFGSFKTAKSKIITLNNLNNIDGAKRKRIRWGRGTGSGRGKLCGFGHQKSLSTPRGFEGGQTPLYKTKPKIGFFNFTHRELETINLYKIQQFIDMGRLSCKPNELITIRDLVESGIISNAKEGVKILAHGKEKLSAPIHLEVSFASKEAIKTIESIGGTITCVHFTPLSLRALLKPFKFDLLPKRARPSPKIMDYYLSSENCGYLSPEIQLRNMNLFGYVTSEEKYIAEHESYMNYKRFQLKLERDELLIKKPSLATYNKLI